MSLFNEILFKLQEKISKESNATEQIATIISAAIGSTVNKEQITIQDATIRIKASPTLKMAIVLNQKKLLRALQEQDIKVTTIA